MNSNCRKLSAISMADNWTLALGDIFLQQFLSLWKTVPHSGRKKAAFFHSHAHFNWKWVSAYPCVGWQQQQKRIKNRVTLLCKVCQRGIYISFCFSFFSLRFFGLSAFVRREETNSCCGLRPLLWCLLRRPLGAEIKKELKSTFGCKAPRKLLALSFLLIPEEAEPAEHSFNPLLPPPCKEGTH